MTADVETKVFHRNLLIMLFVVGHSNYTGVLLFKVMLLLCWAQCVQIMCFGKIALMRVVIAEFIALWRDVNL